jgi:hypothetical protein
MKLIGVLLALALPAAPLAQVPTGVVDEPIAGVAVDLQGSLASFPQDASLASSLGTTDTSLPGRGLGGRVAATIYPLRMGPVTIGLGGALGFARGTGVDDLTGDRFTTTFLSAAPQLSLNFGRQRGWSYLSGGIGGSRLTVAPAGTEGGPAAQTLDYGGGARWFVGDRLAFSFDLRFYKIAAAGAADGVPARGATTMMVVSAGLSLK